MTTNGRRSYYQTLTRVGEVVDETIDQFLKEDEFGDYKEIIYEPLLKKKRGEQKLRATLTYLAYCAFTGQNPSGQIDEGLAKLMVSTEFELWSEYMANWIFDNKGNVRRDPLIRKKAAVATKSFLEDAVRISSQVGEKYAKKVLDTSGHVTNSFTKEFIMDISNKQLLEGPFEKYIKLYKIDYAVPGIGKTISLGADLAALYANKDNDPKAKKLSEIFEEYGVYLEILNDLGDFVKKEGYTTSDKVASDQFADIRNGAMTPPIWLMYNGAEQREKEFLLSLVGRSDLSEFEQSELVRILFETGTYDRISKEIKQIGRKLKKQIKQLEFGNAASPQLQQAMTIFESNKIFRLLRINYENLRKDNLNVCEK